MSWNGQKQEQHSKGMERIKNMGSSFSNHNETNREEQKRNTLYPSPTLNTEHETQRQEAKEVPKRACEIAAVEG